MQDRLKNTMHIQRLKAMLTAAQQKELQFQQSSQPPPSSTQETINTIYDYMVWLIKIGVVVMVGIGLIVGYLIYRWRIGHGYHWGSDAFSFNGTITSLDTMFSSL